MSVQEEEENRDTLIFRIFILPNMYCNIPLQIAVTCNESCGELNIFSLNVTIQGNRVKVNTVV